MQQTCWLSHRREEDAKRKMMMKMVHMEKDKAVYSAGYKSHKKERISIPHVESNARRMMIEPTG